MPAVACCCTVVRRAKPMHGELWRASAAADTNVTARTRAAGGSTPSHDEGASKVMPAVACHCKIKRQAEAAAWQAVAFAGTRAATCAGAACGRTPLHDEAMSTVVPAAACHRAMKRQARQEPSPLTAPAARGDGQPCSKHTALAVAAAAAAAASKRAMRESAAATDAYGGRGTRCDRRRWRRRTWRRQSMQQARRLG